MINIHEILKSYGVEIPEDKKTEFNKTLFENYKTVAEVEKINDKLTKANNELTETKGTLETTTKAFEDLKNSNASKEDWEKKYNDLVEDNRIKAEQKAQEDFKTQARTDFNNYFLEQNKEWANPKIADGYFIDYLAEIEKPENKSKTSGEILHCMTKDDATAFKTTQPIVTLKGTAGGLSGADIDDAKVNAIMGIKTE